MRYTTLSYRLRVTSEQAQVLSRNAGASRFAFNQGLAMLNAAYEAHKANPGVKVPYSKFDLINAFNAWKRSPAAANEGAESPGLAWRDEVIAQVFEEGLTDLSCAVKRFFDARKQGARAKAFPASRSAAVAKCHLGCVTAPTTYASTCTASGFLNWVNSRCARVRGA